STCIASVFSSRRRHTRFSRDWSSDVCSSDLAEVLDRPPPFQLPGHQHETYVLDPRNAQDQDDIIGVEQQPQLFQRSGELPGVQGTIMDVADNTVIVVQRDDRTGGCNLCCCIYCYHFFTTS